MSFFTISTTNPFAETLAQHIFDVAQNQKIPLAAIKVFLPTRRGIRTLQDAFLRLSKGKPLVLPIMQSIGDADLDEIGFYDPALVDIPPAISPLRRQLQLAQIITKAFPEIYTFVHAMEVAKDLGTLIDQIHTENITIDKLDNILEDQEFAKYWEITVQFLKTIIGDLWPACLAEEGMVDPGLQRRLRIESLTKFYEANPPKTPVIMAGSTGSIPAVRDFIKCLNGLETGSIIVPGLDMMMANDAWFAVGQGHPQFLLKTLLGICHVERSDVVEIGEDTNLNRHFLCSEMMRPAETTHKWQALSDEEKSQQIENGVDGVVLCHGDNDHHEAMIIALAMAEIAHDPNQEKTATLITPNRLLAMRVQANLRQWGIDIDDSGGTSLTNTMLGQFALNIVGAFDQSQVQPIPFLTAMKNTLVGGGGLEGSFRSHLRVLEKDVFRGVRPVGLPDQWRCQDKHQDILDEITRMFSPLWDVQNGQHSLTKFVSAHVMAMENCAMTTEFSGADRLWRGDTGEALSLFFQNLMAHADIVPPMTLGDYRDFLTTMLKGEAVSAKYGKHPRLSILGQIESRMVMADRVILSGLNEGVWPPDSGFDVWMSRNMRSNFGLPALEQKTTLAAHDFASGFCAKEVFITRSNKSDGAPTQMSRWLQRLYTVLMAANISQDKWPDTRGRIYADWADKIRQSKDVQAIDRPSPKPSLSRRPKNFSATEIEKFMRDPYVIYAKKILNLKPMDKVDRSLNVADRGTIIHAIVEKFTTKYPTIKLPHDALGQLIQIGKDEFAKQEQNSEIHGLWWPRFEKMAGWFVNYEDGWRKDVVSIYSENKGSIQLDIKGEIYTLSAKADRIEKRMGNHIAVIDYKTGTPPNAGDVNAGLSSQLPIESLLISKGAFDNIIGDENTIYEMYYWDLGGKGEGGEVSIAQGKKVKDTQPLVDQAQDGLYALFGAFHDEEMPYLGSPDPDKMIKPEYNDYAHLERIAEWSDSDGEEDTSS